MRIWLCLFLLALPSGPARAEQDFRLRANHFSAEYSAEDVLAEIEVGKSLAARILDTVPLSGNESAQRYLNSLGSYVVSKVGRPELTYYFGILDSPDTNAYALPGGFIFVTKEALKRAGSEAALLGILAHEIGHVNERHAVKDLRIRGASFLNQVAGALAGAQTQTFQRFLEGMLSKALVVLFRSGLSSADEFSADRYAASFLASVGISPAPYREFLERIHQGGIPVKIMKRTHPPLQERIRTLEAIRLNPAHLGSLNDERYKGIAASL